MYVHYVTDFVRDCGLMYLDYYNSSTLSDLNTYISNNVNTSEWGYGDLIKVLRERSSYTSSDDCYCMFFWNGYSLVYPFYDGALNTIGSSGYEIDQQIDGSGYVPNMFQAIHNFDVTTAINNLNGCLSNHVYFSCLQIFSEQILNSINRFGISNNYEQSQGVISVCCFNYGSINYYVMYLGDFTDAIYTHLSYNRPYDFDIFGVVNEFNLGCSVSDLYEAVGASSSDIFMFIHPRFLNIDYNNYQCSPNRLTTLIQSSKSKKKTSKGKVSKDALIEKSTPTRVNQTTDKRFCCSVTGKGGQCSRAAKSGHDYCGIHLRVHA